MIIVDIEITNAYKFLVGKPEGRRPLGKARHRWDKMDVIEIVCEDVDWNHLANSNNHWWTLVNIVINLLIP
jgi:hypothetical protein